MSKFLTLMLAVITFAACANTNEKMKNSENEKTVLSFTTEQAAWMSVIACDEAKGDLMALMRSISWDRVFCNHILAV